MKMTCFFYVQNLSDWTFLVRVPYVWHPAAVVQPKSPTYNVNLWLLPCDLHTLFTQKEYKKKKGRLQGPAVLTPHQRYVSVWCPATAAVITFFFFMIDPTEWVSEWLHRASMDVVYMFIHVEARMGRVIMPNSKPMWPTAKPQLANHS